MRLCVSPARAHQRESAAGVCLAGALIRMPPPPPPNYATRQSKSDLIQLKMNHAYFALVRLVACLRALWLAGDFHLRLECRQTQTDLRVRSFTTLIGV